LTIRALVSWCLYVEVRLTPQTERTYRCLWNTHIRARLGGMQLREITPMVVSRFISELRDAGVGVHGIRACLGLLQNMFSRAVEWDRARINVVKLVAKPRAPRARAVKPLLPPEVEAIRAHMLANRRHGLQDATLVSVFAYAGLRPEEALALEWRHLRESTILIIHTATVTDGRQQTRRTYRGPVPYHLRHSFASLLIHEGQHSLVQISEWLGHSTATLLANYAHVIADVAGRSLLSSEHAIKAARAVSTPHAHSNSTAPSGRRAITRWLYT
jgi:integrase